MDQYFKNGWELHWGFWFAYLKFADFGPLEARKILHLIT